MSHTIKIIDHDGQEHILEATIGFSLMEIIRDAGLDIEAICGGCCACATCHCYVNEEWFSKLSPADDDEESMLDQAFDIKKNSRLSCQIPFTHELDGIVLTLAPKF
jgi:2Fe-2S ferredoxin